MRPECSSLRSLALVIATCAMLAFGGWCAMRAFAVGEGGGLSRVLQPTAPGGDELEGGRPISFSRHDLRQAVRCLLQLNGSSTIPFEVDGWLYVRAPQEHVDQPARRLFAREGVIEPGAILAGTEIVAAVFDGAPFVPIEATWNGGAQLVFASFDGHLFEVNGVEGHPAPLVQMRKWPGGVGARVDLDPKSADIVTHGGSRSPVLLGANALGDWPGPDVRLVARDRQSCWTSIAASNGGRFHVVNLAPGGGLDVDCSSFRERGRMALHVNKLSTGPAQVVFCLRDLEGHALIEGLSPGPHQIRIGLPNCAPHEAAFALRVVIEAGKIVRVAPGSTENDAPPYGYLSGSLEIGSLPSAADPIEVTGFLELFHELPIADSSQAHARGRVHRVPFPPLGSSAAGGLPWMWQPVAVPAGGYRVVVSPFGVQEEVWIHPGESKFVRISLPLLARVSVTFRDRRTGEHVLPAQVRAHRALQAYGDFRQAQVWTRRHEGLSPRIELIAAEGLVKVSITDPVYGDQSRDLVVGRSAASAEFELREAVLLVIKASSPSGTAPLDPEWWSLIAYSTDGGVPVVASSMSFAEPAPTEAGVRFGALRVWLDVDQAVTVHFPPLFGYEDLPPKRIDLQADSGVLTCDVQLRPKPK